MVITEKRVNASHRGEVALLVVSEKGLIRIDLDDVKSVLVGKEGILYQANQEEGVDFRDFMNDFFDELKKKEAVQSCTNVLLSISMPKDEPLMMDDLEIVHNFFASFENKDIEFRWGIKYNEKGNWMSILAVCTKDCQ